MKISDQLRKVELIHRYKKQGLDAILPHEKKALANAFSEYLMNDGIIVPSRMRLYNKESAILCEDTEVLYQSQSQLARELNINRIDIYRQMKKNNGIINGKKYRVV